MLSAIAIHLKGNLTNENCHLYQTVPTDKEDTEHLELRLCADNGRTTSGSYLPA